MKAVTTLSSFYFRTKDIRDTAWAGRLTEYFVDLVMSLQN